MHRVFPPAVCSAVLVRSVNSMTATPSAESTFFGLDTSQLVEQIWSLRRRISKRVLLLEFGPSSILLAEATLVKAGVQLSHVSSIDLPAEAMDRGVPAEPLKMASLIQQFCIEKQIPAHRAAVVLPPEIAFQRLLDLPATLSTEEAREYVLNPSNGLQIPFPLSQTDFDLFPVSMPTWVQESAGNRLYMLTAIPEVLINPIIEMLQAADFELQLLELGSYSQLRSLASELIQLAPQQIDLVLDMSSDHSELMFISRSGLLVSERLVSIRDFPEPKVEQDQIEVALNSGISAEDFVIKDENYLPLSDLDLRAVASDLRASLERFHLKCPGAEIRRVVVTGVNSSHPLLVDLLAETLNLPVILSRFTTSKGLASLSMDDLLLQSGLGRLTGLALGLLPGDQLLESSLEGDDSNIQVSQHQSSAVAITDLLSSSQAQMGLDVVAVEASPDVDVAEEIKISTSIPAITTTVEDVSALDLDPQLKPDLETGNVDQSDQSLSLPEQNPEVDVRPSGSSMSATLSEELSEIVIQEKSLDSSLEEEWPSIHSLDTEQQPDISVLENVDSTDDQWPSITSMIKGVGDEVSPDKESDVLDDCSFDSKTPALEASSNANDSLSESHWPSIGSAGQISQDLVEDVVVKVNDSEWPSIASDRTDESVAPATSIDHLDPSIQMDEESSKQSDVEPTHSLNSSLSQTVEFEQSNAEDSSSSTLSAASTVDHASQFVIPDLNVMADTNEKFVSLGSQPSSPEDVDPAEVLQDLGELRFADED